MSIRDGGSEIEGIVVVLLFGIGAIICRAAWRQVSMYQEVVERSPYIVFLFLEERPRRSWSSRTGSAFFLCLFSFGF
jgi:hypothetical protein